MKEQILSLCGFRLLQRVGASEATPGTLPYDNQALGLITGRMLLPVLC